MRLLASSRSFFFSLTLCGGIAASAHAISDLERRQTDLLYKQGLEQIAEKDFQAAAATFQQLLQITPDHYEARLGLGEIHLRQRRFDEARQQLEWAIPLAPQRLEARLQLARVYQITGRQLEARQILAAIVADFPEQIPIRMALADLLMTQEPSDPRAAFDHYRTLVGMDPDNLRARTGTATARLRLGDFAAAAEELIPLTRRNPGNPNLTFLLAIAYHRLGDWERAVAAYEQSIDALPAASPQRPLRLWNLHLVYLAAYGQYPGDLPASHRLDLPALGRPSPVRFADIAGQAGISRKSRGRGGAWGDYDSDGDLDLFAVAVQFPHALYRNEGDGAFTDVAPAVGLDDARGSWSATCADYDNDGDLDLYVTRDAWAGRAPNALYQNRGDGAFAEVGNRAGVDDGDDSYVAAWADYDNDGFLDLYVADGIIGDGAANKLYRNQGDGTFAEVGNRAGVGRVGRSRGVAFGDYDRDGDLDLYVVDAFGPNALYRNESDGGFTDVTASAGVAAPLQGGSAPLFFDTDGDGRLDLFVAAEAHYESFVESQITGRQAGPTRASLYHNRGDGTFTDLAEECGLDRAFGTAEAGFGDVDADGRVDLYLANGGPSLARFEPDILLHNEGNRFTDITVAAGLGSLQKGQGVSFADCDADGDLDLYVGAGGLYPGDPGVNSLYRNQGHGHHWLMVEAHGKKSNRSAIGARLRVVAGELIQEAEVGSRGGPGSPINLPVEFGLGNHTTVDTLQVYWPSGATTQLVHLEVDRILQLIEEE